MPHLLVAVAGKARHGKDSIAQVLVREFGFTRFAFGDALKDALLRVDPYVEPEAKHLSEVEDLEHNYLARLEVPRMRARLAAAARYFDVEPTDELVETMLTALNPKLGCRMRLSWVVERYGWEAAKDHPRYGREVRGLLQRFATDVMRTHIRGDVWVVAVDKQLAAHNGPAVISDVRFDNEAMWAMERGGVIWNVVRPGVPAVQAHVSEAGISPALIDVVVDNDGTLDDLAARVRTLYRRLAAQPTAHRSLAEAVPCS